MLPETAAISFDNDYQHVVLVSLFLHISRFASPITSLAEFAYLL